MCNIMNNYNITSLEVYSCRGKATFLEERDLLLEYHNVFGNILKRHPGLDQANRGLCDIPGLE